MADRITMQLHKELSALREQGLLSGTRELQGKQGASACIDGRTVINLASNNYLGLANHPRVVEAAAAALQSWGTASVAGRTIVGTMIPHLELERKVAQFKGTDAAVLFTSGYVANAGAIPALVDEHDVIVSDELNHGSIIDGCRLSKARRIVYSHRDLKSLESCLKDTRDARRVMIVTDTVFSMDGDIAPLNGIVDLASRHGAFVYADDAHGSGVLGRNGKGAAEHFNLVGGIDVEMGTLSKALGAYGGFVAGSTDLCDWLRHSARSFLLTTSLPPTICASAIAALEVLESEPGLVERLSSNAEYFRSGLRQLGFDTGASETPIIPVIIGETRAAMEMSRRLFLEGVFAQGIGYPIVPKEKSRLRVQVTAIHSRDHMDSALDAFGKVGKDLAIAR